jgi:phosphatidylinositol alpha-1,6-mannosyltransferase
VRLLLITNDYPPKAGGIQQYLGNLVASLDAEVRVLAPADEGGGPGVHRDRRRFMWPTRRVRRWVEWHVADFAPDAILFGAPYPLPWLGPAVRRATGMPYGVLCHGAEITLPAALPVARQLLRRPLRRADVLFAVSGFTRRRVERLTRRPVVYVGAGVDVGEFTPGPAREGPPVVGCVSRFVPRKGQARVLRAVRRLRDRGFEAEVLLVGQGRDERKLRRLAAALAVPTRFEVAVPWDALPGLYRQMTVFAMPCRSRWLGLEAEGLGLVFLEAAAAGLPVLAGDSGGSPETVVPGVTGFVVPADRHLEDGLARLLSDRDASLRMGEAGRSRVLEEYTWEAAAGRLTRGLESALRRG